MMQVARRLRHSLSPWKLSLGNIPLCVFEATPFLAGAAVAATALAGRYGIQTWQAFKARPARPKIKKFYEGGFQPTMTRREAALILGIM